MPKDQYGQELKQGDSITIQGSVLGVKEGKEDYLNCEIQLSVPMPPTGAQTRLNLNSQQLVKSDQGGGQAQQQPASQDSSGQPSQQQIRQMQTSVQQITLMINQLKTAMAM